jgi:hypothetical protein
MVYHPESTALGTSRTLRHSIILQSVAVKSVHYSIYRNNIKGPHYLALIYFSMLNC